MVFFDPTPFRMSKRRRGNSGRVIVARAKRPIDKRVVAVVQAVTAVQSSTTLYTATVQSTLVGWRWELNFDNNAAQNTHVAWALVHVREGDSANALTVANASTLYAPEQNVLAWGICYLTKHDLGSGELCHVVGSTKTMRKMQGGDTMQLIAVGPAATDVNLRGAVQWFSKA